MTTAAAERKNPRKLEKLLWVYDSSTDYLAGF
jgi:hypothetical protein